MHREQWRLLAAYNVWMNKKVYAASSRLSPDELRQDRKAFFGSIIGTLNHLAVGDTIWLKRFRAHLPKSASLESLDPLPAPQQLTQILFDDLQRLAQYRENLDNVISAWIETITEEDLGSVMRFKNLKGVENHRSFAAILLHFFNHQTHHRGQVIDLLFQAGIDVGVTDLVALIPDAS